MHVEGKAPRIIAAAALTAVFLLSGCAKEAANEAAAAPRPAPEVGVLTVAPEPVVVTTELPGRAQASLIAEVRPQVGGIIEKRLFAEGSDVKAGALLYEIDASAFKAASANAEAALALAKASLAGAEATRARADAALENAEAGRSRAEAAVADAKAALVRAEANAVPARLRKDRFAELAKARAVSRQDADDAAAAAQLAEAQIESAKAAVKSAEAGVEGADAALTSARAEIAGADASVAAAHAEIAAADAALETARINLSHTKITAPISGRIGKSSLTVGALAVANQPTPLATIQKLDPIYVDLTQSMADLLRLRKSFASGELERGKAREAMVMLRFEDGSAYEKRGKLGFADVMVDQGTGSVTLRTLFPNPRHEILPGMYVRATVEEGSKADAILVPQRAVSRDPAGNPQVLVVGAEEKAEIRPLRVDRAVGDRWLVAEGLRSGDRVILEGSQKARPGTTVRAVPFGASSAPAK